MVSASGDPLAELKAKSPPVAPSIIAAQAHRLRLDEPLLKQYWQWLLGIFHGDWGPSVSQIDIGHEIGQRLLITVRLIILAIVLALVFAVAVGVVSAVKRYSILDHGLTFVGFLFLSMPAFWFAILLKQWAINTNDSVGRMLFFTVGEHSIPSPVGVLATVGDLASHLVLPTIVLAATSFAPWSRYVRSSMIEVQQSDYVRLARAKGLNRRTVLTRHALRTALIPLTTVVALDLSALFSGAIITETVFQWHGMGDFLLTSIRTTDIYGVMAWLLIVATLVVIFNLIADLLYAVLDRRIQLD